MCAAKILAQGRARKWTFSAQTQLHIVVNGRKINTRAIFHIPQCADFHDDEGEYENTLKILHIGTRSKQKLFFLQMPIQKKVPQWQMTQIKSSSAAAMAPHTLIMCRRFGRSNVGVEAVNSSGSAGQQKRTRTLFMGNADV